MGNTYFDGSITIEQAITAILVESKVIYFEAGNNKRPEGQSFVGLCTTVESLCNELAKIANEYSYITLSFHN